MKVKKKGLGQPSPAEEPEGPGAGGDSRAGAAGGLLLPNRVGQEEPVGIGMAAPHPGERGLWGLPALPALPARHDPQGHPAGRLPSPATWPNTGPWSLAPPSALPADQLSAEPGQGSLEGERRDI